jgi:transcriptional regulator with XRE-family HTH domain
MLAIVERLAADQGIGWAFCDTDSMALAKPSEMPEPEFLAKVEAVRGWFAPLNPYSLKVELFKMEPANYRLENGKPTTEIGVLYCWAISAKRNALFNIGPDGRPIIRKASAHGLGHLLHLGDEKTSPPDIPEPSPDLDMRELKRWQYNFWYRILEAALQNNPNRVDLKGLSFDRPALSRYSATSPTLLRWFKKYNRRKSYAEQVKPFGFMYSCPGKPAYTFDSKRLSGIKRGRSFHRPKVVAPFEKDPSKALAKCFDRETGKSVPIDCLESYATVLAQYHLRPESKFRNADYTDTGLTLRRHIVVTGIEYIGKEANRWEEQHHLGNCPDARVLYGVSPDDFSIVRDSVILECQNCKVRELARASGLSVGEVSAVRRGSAKPSQETIWKLIGGLEALRLESQEFKERVSIVVAAIKGCCQQMSVREFARSAELDHRNLTKVLNGRRIPTTAMLSKLELALSKIAGTV